MASTRATITNAHNMPAAEPLILTHAAFHVLSIPLHNAGKPKRKQLKIISTKYKGALSKLYETENALLAHRGGKPEAAVSGAARRGWMRAVVRAIKKQP